MPDFATAVNPRDLGSATWRERYSVQQLREWTVDAHQRSLDLVNDLTDEQLLGPKLETVNPLLWEMGHVTWFYESFLLRRNEARPCLIRDGDGLYDSIAVPHQVRWDLPLHSKDEVLLYSERVFEQIMERLSDNPTDEYAFLHLMSLFHEDMHHEAYAINRQAWGFPRPRYRNATDAADVTGGGPCSGDVEVDVTEYSLGAPLDSPFVHDNEKWLHAVSLEPFRIARAPVTQAEFLAFVEDDGYSRPELWSDEGRRWCEREGATCPVYWQKLDGTWHRREFEDRVPLEPHRPVINVGWHEAQAFCRWADRRLPTEAEWEAAASLSRDGATKRYYPWGDDFPDAARANLDGSRFGTVDVGALAAGDAAGGCRQMIGNVWEWTSTDFLPYPGFVADPYKEYSQPWFGDHKVLRGGAWPTRSRLIRCTWRNFYTPDRRDAWAGFRTCAPREKPSGS